MLAAVLGAVTIGVGAAVAMLLIGGPALTAPAPSPPRTSPPRW